MTFSPTTTGSASGTLTITDTASNSPPTLTLSDTGVTAINCSSATVSDPNLTELFPLLFLPEASPIPLVLSRSASSASPRTSR